MQKLKCKNKRKEEKLLGDSKTVLKSSGQKVLRKVEIGKFFLNHDNK